MPTPLPPVPENGPEKGGEHGGFPDTTGPASGEEGDGQRIGALRGASVQIDGRSLGRIALGVVMVTLAVLIVVLTLSDVHSNNQIDRLHDQGVPVTVTVTGCLGLLGGSGSNAAGYSCHATYTLDGRSYNEQLPGTTLYRPGTEIPAVAVPGDPALVSPVHIADAQHASTGVFIVPAVLGVVLLGLVALSVLSSRAHRQRSDQG